MEQSESYFRSTVTILYVEDLESELEFYRKLGWEIVFQEGGPHYFTCLGYGDLSFALEKRDKADVAKVNGGFSWGFTTEDLRPMIELAQKEHWKIRGPICYWAEKDRWKMWIPTPNGYELGLEGPNPETPTS